MLKTCKGHFNGFVLNTGVGKLVDILRCRGRRYLLIALFTNGAGGCLFIGLFTNIGAGGCLFIGLFTNIGAGGCLFISFRGGKNDATVASAAVGVIRDVKIEASDVDIEAEDVKVVV